MYHSRDLKTVMVTLCFKSAFLGTQGGCRSSLLYEEVQNQQPWVSDNEKSETW